MQRALISIYDYPLHLKQQAVKGIRHDPVVSGFRRFEAELENDIAADTRMFQRQIINGSTFQKTLGRAGNRLPPGARFAVQRQRRPNIAVDQR